MKNILLILLLSFISFTFAGQGIYIQVKNDSDRAYEQYQTNAYCITHSSSTSGTYTYPPHSVEFHYYEQNENLFSSCKGNYPHYYEFKLLPSTTPFSNIQNFRLEFQYLEKALFLTHGNIFIVINKNTHEVRFIAAGNKEDTPAQDFDFGSSAQIRVQLVIHPDYSITIEKSRYAN